MSKKDILWQDTAYVLALFGKPVADTRKYDNNETTSPFSSLPHGMRFNMAACADQYALVAEAMGASKPETSDDKSAEEAVKAIEELNRKIGLPGRLREVDVPREGLKDCAELSLSDGAIVYNPQPVFEAEEVLKVYEAAW